MGLNKVINIIKESVKPFNKGTRLLTKETGVRFADGQNVFHNVHLPEGAVSGSFVSGELDSVKKEGFSIVSFFDNKGRLIDRRRFKIINGQTQEKVTLFIQMIP